MHTRTGFGAHKFEEKEKAVPFFIANLCKRSSFLYNIIFILNLQKFYWADVFKSASMHFAASKRQKNWNGKINDILRIPLS